MAKEKIKEYTNGEITVVWKPERCYHAKNCIHELPDVYNPNERPWIKIENATTEALQQQVKTCPSGALTYYMNNETKYERRDHSSSSY